MQELALKYGCNPNQQPARIFVPEGDLPFTILSGSPGYINLLDALNGYQLVRELSAATGLMAATSFKHVSPAGVGLSVPLSATLEQIYFVGDLSLSPLATAYARARGADRMSSYGDFVALSHPCDLETALLLKDEVSDGVIAPGYSPEALDVLREKRSGRYNVIQIDPDYTPKSIEQKDCYGLTFEQHRNDVVIDEHWLDEMPTRLKSFSEQERRDLLLSLITLKYTQSNAVCYALDGQAIGIGAGQQSRIHCTRLAGNKADLWYLRQHPLVMSLPFFEQVSRAERDNAIDCLLSDHEADQASITKAGGWEHLFSAQPMALSREEKQAWLKTLTGVSLGSDAFFPFGDNILRAARSGVTAIVQPGGSMRDDHVIAVCDELGIAMAFCGTRLFHH